MAHLVDQLERAIAPVPHLPHSKSQVRGVLSGFRARQAPVLRGERRKLRRRRLEEDAQRAVQETGEMLHLPPRRRCTGSEGLTSSLRRTAIRASCRPRCYDRHAVYSLCCTQILRDRLKVEAVAPTATATTSLGNWYATVLFWKPQAALVMSERTLLPVLMPLAPVSTLASRFPAELARVLIAVGMPADFVAGELREMHQVVIAKTANRSVLGMINDFTFMARAFRDDVANLHELALRLSDVPCGPLRGNSPAQRVREMITSSSLGVRP